MSHVDAASSATLSGTAAMLRAHGLRATQQRLAVLETVTDGGHLLADEIARSIQAGSSAASDISLQSVYVVLADLERVGLIRKVDLGTGKAFFETRVGDNHHHAICKICGAVEDIDCAVGHAPCIDTQTTGMVVEAAEVIFRGTCKKCSGSPEPSAQRARFQPLEKK